MTLAIPLIIVIGVMAWVLRPGKRPTKPRRFSILAAAIPPAAAAIAAIIFQLMHNADGKAGVSDISNICFIIGLVLVGSTVLALIGFLIARKEEIAKGIGFGFCIATVLVVIVFALLEWLAGV